MVAGLVFGLWPALRFSRPQISQVLQASSRRSTAGGGQRSLRLLIGVQIALTLVMLTVAGAAITGFVNLVRLQLGYNPANITFVSVGYAKDTVKTWAERTNKAEQLRQTIEAVPGVVSAAASDDIPPSGGGRCSSSLWATRRYSRLWRGRRMWGKLFFDDADPRGTRDAYGTKQRDIRDFRWRWSMKPLCGVFRRVGAYWIGGFAWRELIRRSRLRDIPFPLL